MSWRPTASLAAIHLRAQVLWSVRDFFHHQHMAEVQTPILSRDTVVDRHIDPISVPGESLGLAGCNQQTYYLQTSPEFAMKRLLAAGMTGIYEIRPVFRAAERGQFHNPEFTMLEWYRVGDDLAAGVQLLASLIHAVAHTQNATSTAAAEIVTYQSVFLKYVGCDPLCASLPELAQIAAAKLSVALEWSTDRDDWLNLMFSEIVQPQLGQAAPTIVTHYPASQSALACLSASDLRTAERFELFIDGIELANGYHELLDARELAQRNEIVNRQRLADGKPALPEHSRLLDAMQSGLPACSGCALGLDRLLMVLSGAKSIDEVIAFPMERA